MSRVRTKLAAVAALLSFGSPVLAQPYAYRLQVTPEEGQVDRAIERRYTPQFNACQRRAVTTRDTSQCFAAEFTRQDDALNGAWRGTYARAAIARKPALLAAQRKWIADRNPFCRHEADGYSGGTIMPVIYVSCRVELTIRRAMWLERLGR